MLVVDVVDSGYWAHFIWSDMAWRDISLLLGGGRERLGRGG